MSNEALRQRFGASRSYEWSSASLVLVLLVGIHTWPLAGKLATHMQTGPDPKTMMSALTDLSRNLVHTPSRLMDGTFYYPYRQTLATLDHQIANAVLVAPLAAAGSSGVTLYNVAMLLSFGLSSVFTYGLVRHLGGSRSGALIGACAFAFGTARVYSLEHAHTLVTQWLPLALWTMHRYLERPGRGRWCAFTGAALLVALSSWHIAVIGAAGMAVVALFTLVGDGGQSRRRILGLAAAAILCGLVLLPLATVYVDVGSRWPGMVADEQSWGEDIRRNSADLLELAALPVESRAPYASVLAREGPALFPGVVTMLLLLPAAGILGRGSAESAGRKERLVRVAAGLSAVAVTTIAYGAIRGGDADPLVRMLRAYGPFAFLGVSLLGAALCAARRAGARERMLGVLVAYAALAGVGALLAMGPVVTVGEVDVGSGLWRLDLLPFPVIMRAPVRLGILLSLGAAVVVGLGVSRWLERFTPRRRLLAAVLLLAAINVDLAFTMSPLTPVPAPTEADRWLLQSGDRGAVIEYPLRGHYWTLYASQEFYRRANVLGLGLLRPPEIRRLMARDDFTAVQLDVLLESSHPRFIVVRSSLYGADELARIQREIADRGRMLELRAQDAGDLVFELVDRASGPRIERRWPASALLDGRMELSFAASLSAGRDDTIGMLSVSLNGRELQRIEGATIEGRPRHTVTFDRHDVVAGINTFELRAGYRYAPDAARRLIGDTGQSLAADIELSAGIDDASIAVNGQALDLRGPLVIAALDTASGWVVAAAAFDADTTTAALAEFALAIPEGSAVAIAAAARPGLASTAMAALRQPGLGAALEQPGAPTRAYVAITVKGSAQGSGVEMVAPESARVVIGDPERRRVQLRGLEIS